MWYWSGGFWWPGFVLMAVFMVFCMLMMVRMMGIRSGIGMCGLGRWFQARDEADRNEDTPGERAAHRDTDLAP